MALTVAQIRDYVRDKSDLNILLEGREQSSDTDIALAMQLAVSAVNLYPPVTSYQVETVPNDALLLYGTLEHLANMEAERQLRNQVNYSAQGLNAGIDDKMAQYNTLAAYYRSLFERELTRFKQFLNMELAWGEVHSPYAVLNPYNYRG